MKLQQLPRLNSKPQFTTADEGYAFGKATKTERRVTDAFSSYSDQLLSLDNSKSDFNPHKGGVVVIDQYLDIGPHSASKVASASMAYNRETGKVESFKVIEDDLNSVSFHHEQYDEVQSSNPTFTSVVNGEVHSYEMNPNTGVITSF